MCPTENLENRIIAYTSLLLSMYPTHFKGFQYNKSPNHGKGPMKSLLLSHFEDGEVEVGRNCEGWPRREAVI